MSIRYYFATHRKVERCIIAVFDDDGVSKCGDVMDYHLKDFTDLLGPLCEDDFKAAKFNSEFSWKVFFSRKGRWPEYGFFHFADQGKARKFSDEKIKKGFHVELICGLFIRTAKGLQAAFVQD